MTDQCVTDCENFDEKNLNIYTGFKDNGADSSGFMMFPKYKYDNGTSDNFSLITDEIEMCFGGIPNKDEKYRNTDDLCLYMWVPLSGRNGVKNKGGVALCKTLTKIDKLTKKAIDDGKEFFKVTDKKGKTELKKKGKLVYTKCVREYTPGSANDDDDDDEDDEDDDEDDEDDGKEKFWRLKAKIDIESKWDPNTKKFDPSKKTKIKTEVLTLDKDGNMQKEKIKTLDDMRRLVKFGATVVLQLDLVKTFLSKNAMGATKNKMLLHTFVVKQILVKKLGTGGANKIVSASVFQGHSTGKVKGEKESDGSDSEDDEKKKSSKKKSSKKDSDSSDSEDDGKKKSSKKKSSKKDSDDSDDDNDKKKKLVKKNKKDSDSEDDDSDE